MNEKYISIDEIAAQYNVSESTVRRWIHSGKLVGHKAGIQWRFSSSMVKEAFEKGILSGGSRPAGINRVVKYNRIPEWARPVLTKWSEILGEFLRKTQPDHVIVNDRRGAKIWELLNQFQYVWGKNLWHSTAVTFMDSKELKRSFAKKKVLLFDEMMQHGKAMHELRALFEEIGSEVLSFVCIRRRSFFESDKLKEYKAFTCEDLSDSQFNDRAALVSRFVHLFEPPLDVDHFVIKCDLDANITIEQLLESLAKLGIAFLIWSPHGDHDFYAITLDRPQFFNASNNALSKKFVLIWDGPCKIRFYVNFNTKVCYCSFITYPSIRATKSIWEENEVAQLGPNGFDTTATKRYSHICIDLAISLFKDFLMAINIHDTGIRIGNSIPFDFNELIATFGAKKGNAIASEARGAIAQFSSKQLSFNAGMGTPPPLTMRVNGKWAELSYDVFQCRTALLRLYPSKSRELQAEESPTALLYREIFEKLPAYSESTIGRVLDYELDRGTIKPTVSVSEIPPQDSFQVARSFSRGEYGVWFEWDRMVLPSTELAIQRTLSLGPSLVEQFLQRRGIDYLTATQFNKLFTNLQHDLREHAHDMLYLAWKADKYGPVPVVPNEGNIMNYDAFLKGLNLLCEETDENEDKKVWRRRYKPPTVSDVPWRKLYKEKISPLTRNHVDGLVRLYCEIAKFKTSMPKSPGSSSLGVFKNPLVVLAAARNLETAYRCSWFELEDWRRHGKTLFSLLEPLAPVDSPADAPVLGRYTRLFAAPARLLYNKIQMYRTLPYLRQQIESLVGQENYGSLAEFILTTVDPEPIFETHQKYPMKNLEWACDVVRAFTSMVRQILTAVGLDYEARPRSGRSSAKGVRKDALLYLDELLSACPDLSVLRQEIIKAIQEANRGRLPDESAATLSKMFNLILAIFDGSQKMPDPRLQCERDYVRLSYRDGLLVRLREIKHPTPYAIAVSDIRNIRNLPRLGDILGISYDDALDNMLQWVARAAKKLTSQRKQVVLCGLPTDNIILVAPSADIILPACMDLIRETSRSFSKIDKKQLAHFGLLRIGISWHHPEAGEGFGGYRSGLIAYEIGDKSGRPLGTISVTEAIFERLSSEIKSEFAVSSKDKPNEQGNVYLRKWIPKRDL